MRRWSGTPLFALWVSSSILLQSPRRPQLAQHASWSSIRTPAVLWLNSRAWCSAAQAQHTRVGCQQQQCRRGAVLPHSFPSCCCL
jgi:hypothetical protein